MVTFVEDKPRSGDWQEPNKSPLIEGKAGAAQIGHHQKVSTEKSKLPPDRVFRSFSINFARTEQSMSDHPRAPVHDAAVYFRVNKNLLASAEEKARQEGMSLSELVRHALRRELREAA